jgi:hypothetical protein
MREFSSGSHGGFGKARVSKCLDMVVTILRHARHTRPTRAERGVGFRSWGELSVKRTEGQRPAEVGESGRGHRLDTAVRPSARCALTLVLAATLIACGGGAASPSGGAASLTSSNPGPNSSTAPSLGGPPVRFTDGSHYQWELRVTTPITIARLDPSGNALQDARDFDIYFGVSFTNVNTGAVNPYTRSLFWSGNIAVALPIDKYVASYCAVQTDVTVPACTSSSLASPSLPTDSLGNVSPTPVETACNNNRIPVAGDCLIWSAFPTNAADTAVEPGQSFSVVVEMDQEQHVAPQDLFGVPMTVDPQSPIPVAAQDLRIYFDPLGTSDGGLSACAVADPLCGGPKPLTIRLIPPTG